MKDPVDLWTRQLALSDGADGPVCGTDEAGRGPLAGPVVAAAVILPVGLEIPGLNDSKKLSPARRDALYDVICAEAVCYAVAQAEVDEIESMNILNAALLAMDRAIAALPVRPCLALVDGNTTRGISIPATAVVGGDGCCASIAAASVLAKVTRDREMLALAREYPQYGFERHKGYGTKEHYAALDDYGPCPAHRPSFLKKYYAARH